MPGKEIQTKPFEEENLPSKLDLVNFINNGQIPFLNASSLMGQDWYYLIVPFTGKDGNSPTLLQNLGDPECFSYYSGDGTELEAEIDNGLRIRITKNTAKKIDKFLASPDINNLIALNSNKKAVELEVKEEIGKIRNLRRKEQKLKTKQANNYLLHEVEIQRIAITQHTINLNSVKRDIREQIKNQTELITPKL
jgi:hypothetical protein